MNEEKTLIPTTIKVAPIAPSANWNYQDSVKKCKGFYISWKTISEEMLQELWLAKQAITANGTKKAGKHKKGEKSWSVYVKECFGDSMSKRNIDSYLNRYCENGFKKPNDLTIKPISDSAKVQITVVKEGDRYKIDIYLPEHEVHYIQYKNA